MPEKPFSPAIHAGILFKALASGAAAWSVVQKVLSMQWGLLSHAGGERKAP